MKFLKAIRKHTQFICLLLLFTLSLQLGYASNKLSLNARKYIGIVEKGKNRGKEIDQWNKEVGNPIGSSYCAAFGYRNLKETKARSPDIKSGLAVKYIIKSSISAKDVAKGYIKLNPLKSYIVVWQKGKTIHGHLAILDNVIDKNTIKTIEANTSSGAKGSQSNGDGVYDRIRQVETRNEYFRITYFTEVSY